MLQYSGIEEVSSRARTQGFGKSAGIFGDVGISFQVSSLPAACCSAEYQDVSDGWVHEAALAQLNSWLPIGLLPRGWPASPAYASQGSTIAGSAHV